MNRPGEKSPELQDQFVSAISFFAARENSEKTQGAVFSLTGPSATSAVPSMDSVATPRYNFPSEIFASCYVLSSGALQLCQLRQLWSCDY